MTHSYLIDNGKLLGARFCPSPNFNDRPAGCPISLLVIHNISLPPAQFGGPYIEHFFCNQLQAEQHPYFASIAHMQVSAHLVIQRDGTITQFVDFTKRAWHAGRSSFDGQAECNDFAIGIELEGTDHIPYTRDQYQQLAAVTVALQRTYPAITEQRITGHSHIAPRKTDPGPAFDWVYFKELPKEPPKV